jgi:hypothetical protein
MKRLKSEEEMIMYYSDDKSKENESETQEGETDYKPGEGKDSISKF